MGRLLPESTLNDLIAQYHDMAVRHNMFRGLSLLQHADEVGKVIARHRARSLLDWGSGAGDAYRDPHRVHERWKLNKVFIRLYDPAFKRLKAPVTGLTFDGVICSDVLEHIPERDVPAVIATLFGHAKSFVWASVCCRPAKKIFEDGTNLHVTLHDMAWWMAQFEAACNGKTFYLVETP